MLWERVSFSFLFGFGKCCANVLIVNKKVLVREVFADEASGDEM